MKLLNPALVVCWSIMTPIFAQSGALPGGVPVELEQQYRDLKLKLESQNSAGAVDVEVLQELERLGKYYQETGEGELALQCVELIAAHGGTHTALRFLAAERGKYMALTMSDGVDRALRLLEAQITLSPQLLKLTPAGVNPYGSPLDIMATCPDAVRAELLIAAGECTLAIPLIENVIATYDTCLGLVENVRSGIRKLDLYNGLLGCYGRLLEEGRSTRCNSDLRRGLYEAILGALREASQGLSISADIPRFLPLAFDPMAPAVEEIMKMTTMVKAAGNSEQLVFYLAVLPHYNSRPRQSTGEDMENAYQEYLALVEELQDMNLKTEYKAYFLLRRLGNAIKTLGDRDLADMLVAEIGSLEPLPDDYLVEMFVNQQEAYLEQFTDANLLTLPFGEIVQYASRGLPGEDNDTLGDKRERSNGNFRDPHASGCAFSTGYLLLPLGLTLLCVGLALRRRS